MSDEILRLGDLYTTENGEWIGIITGERDCLRRASPRFKAVALTYSNVLINNFVDAEWADRRLAR